MSNITFDYVVHVYVILYPRTLDKRTTTPALRQTGTAINIRNTRCIILKFDSFNIKPHIVYKPMGVVLAFISVLEQHNTPLLSQHLEVWGESCFVWRVNHPSSLFL